MIEDWGLMTALRHMDNGQGRALIDLITAAENTLGQKFTYNAVPDINQMARFIWKIRSSLIKEANPHL